ncbi:UNVERIFIED_CONTAM: hypothetical protein Sradi_5186300 [Sesamum radiatum]|uniref:Uncharacterized protein n=1 Tax=Sesamum radiatum TaxID=300843 RepID=A0AAW2M6K0_SESRA
MAEGTRVVELRKDVEGLKEQLRLSAKRSKKSIEELGGMIAAIVVVMTNNPHNNHNQGQSGKARGESQGNRGHYAGANAYHIPTKCSQVEFLRFNGEDLRGWIYICEQFFDVDDTWFDAKVKLAVVHMEGNAL